MNLARRAALLPGLPETVPGTTVNRFCASSLQTTDGLSCDPCRRGRRVRRSRAAWGPTRCSRSSRRHARSSRARPPARRETHGSGRDVDALPWFEAFALWEGCCLLRGDLRPLRPRRAHRGRRAGEPLRGGRSGPRRSGSSFAGLSSPCQPLFVASALDDVVTVSEARACLERAVLVPEGCDALFELVQLLCERLVVTVGKQMPELAAALGRGVELGVDLIESSHASENDLALRHIPQSPPRKK